MKNIQFFPLNGLEKVEMNIIKDELRRTIKKQFKKHTNNHNHFNDIEILNIYGDCLSKLLEKVPENVNDETYLSLELFS